jgi:hypothetical protein
MESLQKSSNINNFTSIENKGKLWNLLLNNGAFNNIDENYLPQVREIFESTILQINYDNRAKDLMSKNKLFLDDMLSKLMKLKQNSIYTAESIREKKLNQFEQDLASKQANFDQFISKPQPPNLDLSDPIEENTTSINDLLEQTVSSRKKDELPFPPQSPAHAPAPAHANIMTSVDNSLLEQILTRLTNIEELLKDRK